MASRDAWNVTSSLSFTRATTYSFTASIRNANGLTSQPSSAVAATTLPDIPSAPPTVTVTRRRRLLLSKAEEEEENDADQQQQQRVPQLSKSTRSSNDRRLLQVAALPASSAYALPSRAVSWQAPSDSGGAGILAYEVRLTSGLDGSQTYIDCASPSCVAARSVPVNLRYGVTFTVAVRGSNGAEWSEWSFPEASLAASGSERPEPPPLAPVVSAVTDVGYQLTWQPSWANNDPVVSYTIEGTQQGGAFPLDITSGLSCCSHIFTDRPKNSEFEYRVAATNGQGWSLGF